VKTFDSSYGGYDKKLFAKANPASFSPSLPRSTFTYFTSWLTLQLTRFVCRNSEKRFLMSSRDTRSAVGSAVDSAAEPAASQSPASVSPPTLLGEASTSQKRKASQLSTSSQMAPPPRRSRRVNKTQSRAPYQALGLVEDKLSSSRQWPLQGKNFPVSAMNQAYRR
jgi:hypothetical protein